MRLVFCASLAVSGVVHCSVVPLSVPPSIEVHDFEGEAAIPVDVLEQTEAPVEEPPPPPPAPVETPPPADEGKDKAAPSARDAGPPPRDASPPLEASSDAAIADGAAADAAEGGAAGVDAAADPQALLSASGAVQADVIYVTVVINAIEIRKNPASARLGEILLAIPQWHDFMRGTEGLIDPVRDADWILISGPALVDSSACVITLHYNASDATVDKAIQIVSSHYEHGGPYDAGAPGVRAWLAHADRAERVLERPRSHVLVIAPPRSAGKVARQIVATKGMKTNIMPGVATWIRVVDPHHALPGLIPEGVLEARLTVKSRDDDGADIALDGDCKDEATAGRAADEVARTIRRYNSFGVALVTNGLLNGCEVTHDGKRVHVALSATRGQIETTLGLVQGFLSGGAPPPATSAAPGSSH